MSDITLSLRRVAENSKDVGDMIDEISQIVGDVPVSVQLNDALSQMASKNHIHEDYVPRAEFDALKNQVMEIIALVGDTSVSAQIANAIEALKIV